jgi:phage shock protein PspC (stress-responsive transcriptional regulator)
MSDTNLFMRDDTFFGVCEGLGEDLGIHANWLRLALGVSVMWNPVAVISLYFGLGAIVLVSRLIVRNPRTVRSAAAATPRAPREAMQVELPLAA